MSGGRQCPHPHLSRIAGASITMLLNSSRRTTNMSKRTIQLLLLDNVESLGIIGDVVKVRTGYARNFLLPMGMAEPPTETRIAELQAERAEALARVEAKRAEREELISRMEEVELTLVRSCNDRGGL